MKSFYKTILFILFANSLLSQQIAHLSHYFYKPLVYNPAYTGKDEAPNLMLIHHAQWAGFKGAPQYDMLTFDGRLINQNTGLGINLISDKKGVTNRIGGNILYSYKLKFNKTSYLRLGLSIGAINQSLNFSNAVIENQNDPSLFSNSQSKTSYDAGAGLLFVMKNFELSLAAPQLANNKFDFKADNGGKTFYTQSRHYMGSMKYKFLINEEKKISVSPLALIRYVPNTPMQYDANLNFDWENKFWLGATYKSDYAIGINAGITLFERLSIGYCYDYITGSINKYGGLSHEIMLNIKLVRSHKGEIVVANRDTVGKKMTAQQELNKLIIDRILKKIDALLDRGNATPEEIHALMEEISAFLDNESLDPMQETLNRYYNNLKNVQGELNVLLKGKVIIEGNDNPSPDDYKSVTISVIDLGTNNIVATCTPHSVSGKYYMILKPGRKYHLIAESKNYQAFSKYFSPDGSIESYEMSQEIRLKK